MKYIIALLVSLALVSPVFAQNTPTKQPNAGAKGILENLKEKVKEVKTGAKEEVKDTRNEIKNEVNKIKTQTSAGSVKQFNEKRAEAQKQFQKQQEEIKKAVEAKKAEAKKEIDKLKVKLREKLKTVKDEAKKKIVENVFNQLNEVKDKRVENFKKSADQIEEVLGRIVNRADKATANGVDTSSITASANNAKAAIAEARSLITAEAGKIYSVSITAEANLKSDLAKTRETLNGDLLKIQQSLKSARDMVHNTAVTLAKISNINQYEVASSTTSESANQ
ncbi:MAG: hypothetical protein AAB503_02855 [Patescibacteria group bacterium]